MRKVFVTGVTSDIGRAIALRFARAGWSISGQFHASSMKAEALAREMAELGISSTFFSADFSTEQGIESAAIRVVELEIDTLVNNAGSYVATRPFPELSFDDLQKAYAVNVFAPTILCSRVFGGMVTRGFGRIVNISSIAAKYGGSAASLHYGCAKMALEGITHTLAREGATRNILVNTVRPGVIDTDFHRKFPKDMSRRIAMIPMQRLGRPEEVAEGVFYLGSEGNTFITNDILTISGGE